jgi:alginate O-acetyltransferase complex protein AlgI
MAICGLWHGAGWTYVAWGVWHGLGLITCHAWQALRRPLPAFAGWAITMLFVLIGWVLFRAADFTTATTMLAAMAGAAGWSGSLHNVGLLVIAAVISALVPSAYEIIERRPILNPAVATAFAVLAGFCVLEVGRGPPLTFIYFRF